MTKDIYAINGTEYGPAQLAEDAKRLYQLAKNKGVWKKILASGIQWGRNTHKEIKQKEKFLREVMGWQTGPEARIETSAQIGQAFKRTLEDVCTADFDFKETEKRIRQYFTLEIARLDAEDKRDAKIEKSELAEAKQLYLNFIKSNSENTHKLASGVFPTEEELIKSNGTSPVWPY